MKHFIKTLFQLVLFILGAILMFEEKNGYIFLLGLVVFLWANNMMILETISHQIEILFPQMTAVEYEKNKTKVKNKLL